MKREIGLEAVTHDASSVVTVGTYDGVHRGHQAILRYVLERAEERGAKSVVVSFDPHPRSVVRGEDVSLLTSPKERADLLEALGVDRFVLVPFTKDFASQEPTRYVEDFLVDTVGLQEIVIGYDHRFGRDREGDRDLLEELGRAHGFDVEVLPAQTVNASQVVSSSAIRRLLMEEGDAERAVKMLGRPYALTGRVVEGAKRGRKLGFPTANLELAERRKVVPKEGVYAVKAYLPGEDEGRRAMMNIGTRPTFEADSTHLEVHILDFDGDIYGAAVRVEFMRRLRDEKRFSSPELLMEQLSKDRDRCRNAF